LGESVIPQKYQEMMMLAAAVKCPYCQTYNEEVSKMWGATNEELNGLAAVVGLTAFWSNILRTQNYDHNTSVEEPKEMGEYLEKKERNKFLVLD
jgi:Carboxymuconolactone decarboxylase family